MYRRQLTTAPRATAEHEKHAMPVEPRGESAKADFVVVRRDFSRWPRQATEAEIINQKVIPLFRAASMPCGVTPEG